MTSRKRQRGYLLVTVVVTLFLLSTIVMLLAYDSASNARSANSSLEAARADHVARAGMQNALWRAQNNACMGNFSIPATALGNDSYAAAVTGTSAGNLVVVDADKDAWIRSDDTDKNNGTSTSNHVRYESGKIEQVLTRFDVSSITANSQINSAIAWFHLKAGKSHPEGPITVHTVTADWNETTVTWDSFGGAYRPETIGTIPAQDTGDVWVAINITGLVQSWVNGQPNNGILFNSEAEGIHTEYTAREDSSNPPRLEVTIGSGPASPAQIQVTGTLGSGVTRSLTRSDVPIYDANSPATTALQPGAEGKDSFIEGTSGSETQNNGDSADLGTNSETDKMLRALLQFDVAELPPGARIVSAELQLTLEQSQGAADTVAVHRITQSWSEGSVTWISRDGSNDWINPGGDYDPSPVGSFTADAVGFVTVDIGQLAQQWVDGTAENHGLILLSEPAAGDKQKTYVSSDDAADPSLHPKLTIKYACECGTPCMTLSGSGTIMLVIDNVFSPTIDDRAKRDLFRSWGYNVNYYDDDTWQSLFDSGFGFHDVVYVAGSASAAKLGDKLTNAPIGVVSEKGELNDNFGFASGYANPVGQEISLGDTSHFITSVFSGGRFDIYEHAMQHLTASGTTSASAQVLATVGAADALVTLDTGVAMQGGGTTAGRRVMLPINEGIADWDYLTGDGLLIVQRSLAWGMNADAVSAGNLLMVVEDDSNLTSQEEAKKSLLESWNYTVSIIDDSGSQSEFDAAVAANDVAYVPEDINSGTLDTKLRGAAIGVVIEEEKITDEFGISTGETTFTGSSIDVTNNTHYITEPFGLGTLAFATSTQPVGGRAGTLAPGLVVLGLRPSSSTSMLDVIDTGGTLADTGTAAGRRVKLPWGGNDFDINSLTDAGRTMMRRSLEWAAGANTESDPGPIAHWELDEASGVTAIDSAGNHDGALAGNPTWTAGTLGGAIELDGVSDRIDVGHDDALSLVDEMTFAAWIRPATIAIEYRTIVAKDGGGSGSNYWFGLWDGDLVFGYFANGFFREVATSGLSLAADTWSHVAASFDNATDTVRLYANGVEVGSGTLAWEPTPVNADLEIGRSPDGEYWHGGLDDVRIYDRVLTEGEIAELATPPSTLPIAHWKLDETSGTTAFDAIGNNDGTLTNGPTWVAGQIGGALDFDGSNDLVAIPHQATFTQVPMTVSAWFKLDTLPTTRSENGTIVDKRHTVDPYASWTLYVYEALGNKIRFQIRDSSETGYWLDSAASAVTDTWYHVVGTIDESYNAKLYVNGALEPDDDNIGSLFTSNDEIRIGAGWSGGNRLDGVVDDVRYYDRALSALEISDLYTAGAGSGGGGGGGGCHGTFRDEFNTRSFSGDDGTLTWTGDWLEVGESNGPTSGDIQVMADANDFQLRTRDNDNGGEGVLRSANLTGAGTATLRYMFRRANLDSTSDYTAVEVSSTGNSGPWTELARHSGSDNDADYQSATVDLTSYASADTTIRLKTSSSMGGTDTVWFDDIEIECLP
ncbi:MAG: DNRLRE domain-containing protein [Woeseiaceae bacterium]|nr:DNRLRE domain-containing protein [Woeseiaceae bacterium]